jgi:hypothetical protein
MSSPRIHSEISIATIGDVCLLGSHELLELPLDLCR